MAELIAGGKHLFILNFIIPQLRNLENIKVLKHKSMRHVNFPLGNVTEKYDNP